MAKHKFSKLAEIDLDEITVYSSLNYGERLSIQYTDSILDSDQLIANFPPMGRVYTTKQGRKFQHFAVGRHVIFYQPSDDGIFIVRVLHQMMDFDRHLDV